MSLTFSHLCIVFCPSEDVFHCSYVARWLCSSIFLHIFTWCGLRIDFCLYRLKLSSVPKSPTLRIDSPLHLPHPRIVPSCCRYLDKKAMIFPTRKTEVHSNLVTHNAHLLGTEFGRSVIQHLHELQRVPDDNAPHAARAWQSIWPQVRRPQQVPMPQYNEAGKYVVKLFWLNAWRKVVVDDMIPIGHDGKVLLPTAPSLFGGGGLEFWPAIITKALLKVVRPYLAGETCVAMNGPSSYVTVCVCVCVCGRAEKFVMNTNFHFHL